MFICKKISVKIGGRKKSVLSEACMEHECNGIVVT